MRTFTQYRLRPAQGGEVYGYGDLHPVQTFEAPDIKATMNAVRSLRDPSLILVEHGARARDLSPETARIPHHARQH